MALAFDAKSSTAFDGTSTTLSHTTSGSDRLLVVAVTIDGSETVSSITYNSVSMTQAATQAPGNFRVYLYYLVNPSTGANDISVTLSDSTDAGLMAASYTGVKQTSPLDVTNAENDNSINVTTTVVDSLIVGAFADSEDAANDRTAGTGVTERHDVVQGAGAGDYGGFFGDRIESSTGTYTVTYTGSASDEASGVVAAFEAGATNPDAPTLETTDDTETTDTTPAFEFNAVDPDGDDVVYNIQIDTATTFDSQTGSPLIDADGDVSTTGFENIDTPADTSPFNSGDTVRYTVQAGDALSRGSHYWRVRAKDPNGSDTYGDWSATRAFHIFKTDRELTISSVANIPSSTSHQYSDSSEAFTDSQYTNVDSDNATRVAKTADANENVYSLQKTDLGSGNFDVIFDGQVADVSTQDTITFDNDSSFSDSGPSSPFNHSWSHTVGSNNNRFIMVGFKLDGPDTVNGVTYDGVSMTKLVDDYNSDNIYVFYLAGPNTGANNIVVDLATSGGIAANAVSYYNVDATSSVDTHVTNINNSVSGSGTTFTNNITTGVDNAMLVDFCFGGDGSDDQSPDTGQTQRSTYASIFSEEIETSEKSVGSSGVHSMGWANDGLASESFRHIIVSLTPSSVDAHVKIDVYNQTSGSWENLLDKTNMSVDTDFSHTTNKTSSTGDYYDGNGFVYARAYTEHETTFRIDKFTIEPGVVSTGGDHWPILTGGKFRGPRF